METKKRKRKARYTLFAVPDTSADSVKKFRFSWNVLKNLISIMVIIALAAAGYGALMQYLIISEKTANNVYIQENSALTEANAQLQTENEELSNKVEVLSDIVNKNAEEEQLAAAEEAEKYLPTIFPLAGPASMTEGNDAAEGETPVSILIFDSSIGVSVVSAASGTVTAVTEDAKYGHSVTVDHGNGYVTIYRCKATPAVAAGAAILQNDVIYELAGDATQLGYQILKDGVFINPLDLMEIYG